MILLLAALQLAVAVPIRLSAKDSANLVAHARDVEFRYLLDWRHEWQGWRAAVHGNQQVALDTVGRLPDPPFIKIPDGVCEIRPPVIMDNEDQQDCIRGAGDAGPWSRCKPSTTTSTSTPALLTSCGIRFGGYSH